MTPANSVFVDTSGWVALLTHNDAHHSRAAAAFEDLQHSRTLLYTSDYVVDETITTILMRGDHKQSVVAGDVLFTSRLIKTISVGPATLSKAWELYKKFKDKKFSFTDVTSFVIMKDLNLRRAFSFDRDFVQAGFETIP
ncbi:MAG: PIN domain-containing protein [Elusimicrobia bacterium]|nr:PIN domain-containing protein [Elusimicrobiota bacterium]